MMPIRSVVANVSLPILCSVVRANTAPDTDHIFGHDSYVCVVSNASLHCYTSRYMYIYILLL